jgi:hypothetical protein
MSYLLDLSCLTNLEVFWIEDANTANFRGGFWITPLISRLHGEKLKKLTISFNHPRSLKRFCRTSETRELDMLLGQPRFHNIALLKFQVNRQLSLQDREEWEQKLRRGMRKTTGRDVKIVLCDNSSSGQYRSVPVAATDDSDSHDDTYLPAKGRRV